MRRLVLVVAASFCLAGCALTRSQVKNLRDAGAARIAFDTPIPTTITALNHLPSHCGLAGNTRRAPEEFRVYEVVGTIARVKREPDGDIHIVLADLQNPRDRVVVEIGDPNSRSGRQSPFRDRLDAARRMFEDLRMQSGAQRPRELHGVAVKVAGVAFYDVYHFQRGRSRSCIELHPVVSISATGNVNASLRYPISPFLSVLNRDIRR